MQNDLIVFKLPILFIRYSDTEAYQTNQNILLRRLTILYRLYYIGTKYIFTYILIYINHLLSEIF